MFKFSNRIYALLVCFGLIFINPNDSFAQSKIKKTRILFLLDASSSMTYEWNAGISRFGVASNILLRIVDSIYAVNNEVEFAVRAYGTQYPAQEKNCTDTKLEVPFNYQNVSQIKTRLQYLKPIGFSPIAYSLKQASENELNNTAEYDYSIIFITDGGESCNGDICNTFKDFLEKKISIKPYVIGLDKNEKLKSYYDCMGNFIEVSTPNDITEAVKMIVDANKKIIEKPKVLKLETKYSNTPILKDTTKKVVKVDTLPKVIKSTIELPTIVYKFFPIKANEKIKLLGKKYAYSIKKATLHFQIEETPTITPKKDEPKLVKETFVYPTLKFNKITLKKIQGNLVAKKYNLKPTKATLHFDWEKPIVKETNVFPYLKMKDFKLTSKSKISIKPKNTPLPKKQKTTLHFEWEEPIVRQNDVFPLLKSKNYNAKKTAKTNVKGKNISLAKNQKAMLHFEWEEHKKENLTFIKAANYPKRYSYAYRIPNQKIEHKKSKTTLHFNIDAPKSNVKKDTVKKVTNTGEMKYTSQTKPSDETKIQIFLLGPDGKIYSKAKPLIEIIDAKTKAPVMKFQRTVENGEPTIQNIPAGDYDIFIREFNVARIYNLHINDKMLNKVMLELEEGTLHFVYGNNLKRPVEFNAVVNRRFANGATIMQKCTQILHYDPGTYYVEINTLPTIKRSIDIEFFKEYLLPIDEPGTLQVSNSNKSGKIELQCVLGDQFVTFYVMNGTGNLAEQKLTLQPGVYKAIFPKDAKMPQAGSKTIDFKITPNTTTTVELQ